MRRIWIVAVVVLVAIAMAVPAAAKKPDNPGKPSAPDTFKVTMDFVDDTTAGFSTTSGCTDGGYLTMVEGQFALNGTGDWPEVRLPGVEWYRYFPYFATADDVPAGFDPNLYPLSEADRFEGVGLFGCHSGGVDVFVDYVDGVKVVDHVDSYAGLFALWTNPEDMDFLWHSAYYREWEPKHLKKKTTWSTSANEDFSLFDVNDTWTWDIPAGCDYTVETCTGLVTGSVEVTHFSPGSYVPFPGSPVPVQFHLTIEPLP